MLIEQFLPLAKSVAYQFFLLVQGYGIEREELEGEALLALTIAGQKYNEALGTFSFFARKVIVNHLKNYRDRILTKRVLQNKVSLDDGCYDGETINVLGNHYGVVDVEGFVSEVDFTNRFMATLLQDERLLLTLRLQEYRQQECSEQLGQTFGKSYSQPKISCMLSRIGQKYQVFTSIAQA